MTPRQKAWEFLLDKMSATFANGDIGGPGKTPADDRRNEKICAAGDKLVADLRRQGPPMESR